MLKRATLFNVRTYIPFEFAYPWERRGRDDLAGLRDRALFLLGLAGALRRAELVGIDREQLRPAACSLQPAATSLRLRVPQSKGDQASERVDRHPARQASGHLPGAGPGGLARALDAGSARCSARSISGQRRTCPARRTERLSPQGLRAGLVTEAYAAGARDELIMHDTGYRDLKTMHGYVRRARVISYQTVSRPGTDSH